MWLFYNLVALPLFLHRQRGDSFMNAKLLKTDLTCNNFKAFFSSQPGFGDSQRATHTQTRPKDSCFFHTDKHFAKKKLIYRDPGVKSTILTPEPHAHTHWGRTYHNI